MTIPPSTWPILVTVLVLISGCQTPGPAPKPDENPGEQVASPAASSATAATSQSASPTSLPSQSAAADLNPQLKRKAAAPSKHQDSKASSATLPVYLPGTDRFVAPPRTSHPVDVEGGKFTLNFENTNLREVVKVILGDLLEANYAIDPRVRGNVTLQTGRPIHRDALLPTLEMVLRMNGAALVNNRNFYNIVSNEDALQGLLVPQLGDANTPLPKGYAVRVVPLEHIGAKEMQEILEPLTTPENVVRVDTERNLLVLSGTGQEIATLLETVRVFDVDWLAGKSFGLFTPEFADVKSLAEELESLFGDEKKGPLAGLVRFVPIERINGLLVITAKKDYLKQIALWVKRLDREPGGTGQRLFVYPVQNGKAIDLANVLSQVFVADAAAPAIPPPELAPGLRPTEITSGAPFSAPADEQRDVRSPTQQPSTPAGTNTQAASRTGTEQTNTIDEREAGNPGASSLSATTQRPPVAGAVPSERIRTGAPQTSKSVGNGLAIADADSIRIIADEVNNALVILATEPQYRQIKAALRKLDVIPLQVLIEATLADVTLTDELTYGVEWFFTNSVGDNTAVTRLGRTPIAIPDNFSGFTFSIVDAASAVKALLRALATERKLDILASPSLMVLNNQAANINIGDEVPVVTQQQQSTLGTSNIINSVQRQRTGVLLTVTPRVNKGGLVIMEIVQNVSNVASGDETSATFGPTIQNREITSTVAVQSGETLVLGGLIRETNEFTESGIPILRKLPLIGPLFRTTTRDNNRTELVVLITPRAVQNMRESRMITEELRSKMQGIRPWPLDQRPIAPSPEDEVHPEPPAAPAPAALPQ
jgi:general secretion pathway protein D